MLQGIATSEFPRSAAGVVALQSAGEYDSKEVRDGIAYLRQFGRGMRPGRRNHHFFYGQYYAAQAMWLQGGSAWTEWYTSIRDDLIEPSIGGGLLAGQRRVQRVWHGDGAHHPADPQRFPADLSTLNARD